MKKGWQKKKLSDLFQVGSSKRVLKSQWKTSGVPFYRGREVTRLAADGFVENELFISEEHFAELSKEYGVPKAGDIVITAIGTIGNSHVVRSSDRFYFKDASVLWMKRTAEVSSEFVNLWLKSPRFFDQLDRGNGATVDTLTIQKLQSVEISAPPLAEQQRIVGVLDEAFAGLATAQAHAAQNLQNARALFASHLQSVFALGAAEMKKGWLEKTVGDILQLEYGKPLDESDRKPNGRYPVYGANGEKDRTDKFYHDKPSIIVGRKGSAGEINLTEAKFWPLDVTYFVTFDEKQHDLRFLYHLLTTLELTKLAKGVKPGINRNEVYSQGTRVPPLAEQQRIVKELDALAAETQRLTRLYEQKQAALAALKKSLLHQAFTGEL